MNLLSPFRRHLGTLQLPSGRGLVAVSGGPDSVTLLHLLLRSSDLHRTDLVVAHFDHGIHPESRRIAEAVGALASSLGVPFESGQGNLGPSAGETRARAARYTWLESVRLRLGASSIFTAHHADDQVETILMRVLAGSGPAGLAGMAPTSGRLVRPLLPFRRAQLVSYARETGLPFWDDPANADPRHLRSWLRREVLPVLRVRLPEVDAKLARVGRYAAGQRQAWDRLIDHLPVLDLQVEEDGISIDGRGLREYGSPLAETILMAVARRAGCPLLPRRSARVLSLLHQGESGLRVPIVSGWQAELAFGRLRLVNSRSEGGAELVPLTLAGHQGESRWGSWRLRWERDTAPERQERASLTAWFALEGLTVRGWGAGDKLRPLGGTGRRLLVRCFQEAKVPRSRRTTWPVIAAGDAVLWVPGVCRSSELLPAVGSDALRVEVELAGLP